MKMMRKSKLDPEGTYHPSLMKIQGTWVLCLGRSIDQKYYAVARLGSFVIYQRLAKHGGMNWRGGVQMWVSLQRIARQTPHKGRMSLAGLTDFTLLEHQTVLRALDRIKYRDNTRLIDRHIAKRQRLATMYGAGSHVVKAISTGHGQRVPGSTPQP